MAGEIKDVALIAKVPATTEHNSFKDILEEIDRAITAQGGILANITKLMDAPEKDKSKEIVNLIGSVIGLVIKCIKVAVWKCD